MTPRYDLFLLLAVCGVFILLFRWLSDRTEGGRRLARFFWTRWSIVPRRAFMSMAPLWAAGSFALGVAALLPRLAAGVARERRG